MNSTRIGFAIVALSLIGPPLVLGGETKKAITLEQTAGRGDRVTFNSPIPSYSFDADGAIVEREAGRDGPGGRRGREGRSADGEANANANARSRRLDPKTLEELPAKPDAGGEDRPGSGVAARNEELEKALAAIEGVGEDGAARIVDANRSRQSLAFDGANVLIGEKGVYWIKDGIAKVVVAEDGLAPEVVRPSRDGRRVAFVSGNDLSVVDLADGSLRRITTDGGKDRLNGKLDWVYQEEIYGRGDWCGHFFSPDGKRLAFLSLDETKVAEFPVFDPIVSGHFRGKLEFVRYPKAGDPNPIVGLSIADLESGAVKQVDLGRYAKDEPLVVSVTFTPDSRRCLAVIQDRAQSYADLVAIDVDTLAWRPWIHEASDSWVDRPDEIRWLKDGGFLWLSQRTGYRHLYRYASDGTQWNAITGGDWSVTGVERVDEEKGLVWFGAKKDGAIERNVYRCRLDGTEFTRLTRDSGSHQLEFSPDGSLFLDRFSSVASPPEVRLCDAGGAIVKVLAKSAVSESVGYSPCEVLAIPARDGFLLDASIVRPASFVENAKYPVWISTYSGPDMPSVTNRWSPSAWVQFLAQHDVISLQVNVRTAAGIGRAISGKCHRRLGKQELEDIEDAIDWVAANANADPERVGITGYSYGGFMAAYALTHSDKFALGIAGGGVYDWRMYDTIYTERYMDLPQRNPEGYKASSVIEAAANLQGHLVFHHGVNDDNVHMQNALQLAYALEKADKTFEFIPYPETGHGIGDRDLSWHNRQLEWNRIQRYLLNGRGARN